MAAAVEVASAYLALYAKMPGVQKDIEKQLGSSEVEAGAEKAGKKAGGGLLSGISGVVKGGIVAVGATLTAGIATALVKGFGRLNAIDTADKKLTGLGNSAEQVDAIMKNALNSVRGTAFGMGDAATVAASLVAANIQPGEQLEGVLKSVANSAAAAGVGLGDMGSIYAKVASTGKAQNDVLQQVADRGVPIYQALANQLGVTTEEVFKMASAGQIGFAQFEQAMTSAAGTVAAEMGQTLPGATQNFLASLGRIGAGLLGGIYPYLAPLVNAITTALGPLETVAAGIGEKIGALIGPGLQFLTDTLNSGIDISGFLDLLSTLSPLGIAFQVLQPVLPMILDMFMRLGGVIGGAVQSALQTLMPVVMTLVQVFSGVFASVMPSIITILNQLAGVFAQVLTAVAPLVAQLVGALMPVFQAISPIIAALVPIFTQLIGILMPIIQAILPVLSSLIATLAPIVLQLVNAFLPLLQPILSLISPLLELVGMILPPLIQLVGWLIEQALVPLKMAFDFLVPVITGVVSSISSTLLPIINTVKNVLSGLVAFLSGVFTGNWKQAWQGIVDIFSGIFSGIMDIGRGVINGVVDLINGVIGGINDVASGVSAATGGAINLSIPTLPHLADGGVVQRRPGGIPAVIGEGRYDEAVVPLSPQVLSQMGSGEVSVTVVNKSGASIGELIELYVERRGRREKVRLENGSRW